MRPLSAMRRTPLGRRRPRGVPSEPAVVKENGFILVVTIVIMAALLILIGAVARSALDANTTASRAAASNEALATADAGAQVGLFRLDTDGATGTTGGSMAHGATYLYSATTYPSTGASGSTACTGLSVVNSTEPVEQGCITSVGTVNGVSAQVQMRVAGYAPTSLFPINGVFAIDGFYAAGSPSGRFSIGSNGAMNFTNATLPNITGDIYYQSGDLTQSQNSGQQCTTPCVPMPETAPIAYSTVSPGTYAAAAAANNDASITWPANLTYSGSPNYTVTSNGANNDTIDLAAGTYYFCSLALGNGTTIQATGSPVKIYMDSSYDTSSGCSSGSGTLTGDNVTVIANGGAIDASGLQLYFYGQPGCTGTNCQESLPQNVATFDAYVFAPNSYENDNPLTVNGAMVIGYVYENTLSVTYEAPTAGTSASSTYADYFPAMQTICTPASTPKSGSC
jgi:hypothetical protein